MLDGFKSIRFKKRTVLRFRGFSKKMAKSYSETLESIMDFFEWHGFTPADRFTKSLIQEILKNRQHTVTSIKRTEASIAIIRDIEIRQTKPTNAMMLSLFEEKSKEEEPVRVEKKFADKPPKEKNVVDITVPKIRYERLADKMNSVKEDFTYVLDKVKIVRNSFGKDYLKLELTQDELIKLKRTLKNI